MTVSFPHVVKPFCFQFVSHASLCYNFVAFDVTGGLKESLKHSFPVQTHQNYNMVDLHLSS